MSKQIDKKIDETWKEQVAKGKESVQDQYDLPEGMEMPEASFMIHVSQLAMQSMVFLGLMPHPVDQSTQVDLVQAKYLIDTIEVLKDKSKGNLSKEEEEGLSTLLYDLRLKYLDVRQKQ